MTEHVSSQIPPNAKWYDVPAGTRPGRCNGPRCHAPIYWVTTPHRKWVPVDCDVDGGNTPSEAASPDPVQLDLLGLADD